MSGHGKGWSDQPDIVEAYTVKFSGRVGANSVEIRLAPNDWSSAFYVTVGGLFNSQTIKCENVVALIETLQQIAEHDGRRKPITVVDGASLVENKK